MLPKFITPDQPMTLLQTQWASQLDPIIADFNSNLDNSGITRNGQKQYLSKELYNNALSPTITATATGWSTIRGVFIPYQMVDGIWRLKFNFSGTATNPVTANTTFTINGVIFSTITFGQAISGFPALGTAAVDFVACNSNSSTIDIFHANATVPGYIISGDVELNAKPTWAY